MFITSICFHPFFHTTHRNFMQTLDFVSKKSVRINHVFIAQVDMIQTLHHDDSHLLSTDTPISLRVPTSKYHN